MNTSNSIPIAIIAAGVILAGAVYTSTKEAYPVTPSRTGGPSKVAPTGVNDHILGNPTAKLMIVEYSDFDCAHCQTFNATLRQIINDYGTKGDVAWTFRNFAITENNPNAKKHAEAAECVAKTAGNEAFFAFADLLFANQPADPAKYAEYARKAGAAPNTIASCIQNAATNGVDIKIDFERQSALDAGAIGTPYSLIVMNGKPPIVIDSAWGYADLKDQIDSLLKNDR